MVADREKFRLRGSLVFLGVAGLVVGLLGPVGAQGSGAFGDDNGSVHAPAIDTLAGRGIFVGTECGEDAFCPEEALQRWVMAVWLVRALEQTPPTPVDSSRFADVDAAQWWAPYVERLAELGLTKGCSADPAEFCPDAFVSRGQMATFLVRAMGLRPAPLRPPVLSTPWAILTPGASTLWRLPMLREGVPLTREVLSRGSGDPRGNGHIPGPFSGSGCSAGCGIHGC